MFNSMLFTDFIEIIPNICQLAYILIMKLFVKKIFSDLEFHLAQLKYHSLLMSVHILQSW